MSSLKPLTFPYVNSDGEDIVDEEGDVEEFIPAIGTRGSASITHDTDPDLEYEKAAVLGVGGKDPTLFYPYGLAVQPHLYLAKMTTQPVNCGGKEDLSRNL